MFRLLTTSLLLTLAGSAEVHTVTLQDAVNLALKQSPEVVLARLDEQRAREAVRAPRSIAGVVESLERVAESVRPRVTEGRDIPLEPKRAEPNLARARQRAEAFAADQDYAESSLALVLGFPAGDRVHATDDE